MLILAMNLRVPQSRMEHNGQSQPPMAFRVTWQAIYCSTLEFSSLALLTGVVSSVNSDTALECKNLLDVEYTIFFGEKNFQHHSPIIYSSLTMKPCKSMWI